MKKIYLSILTLAAAMFLFGCSKNEATTDAKLSYSFSATNLAASLGTVASASGVVVAPGTNGSISWTTANISIAKAEFSTNHAGNPLSFEVKNFSLVNALHPDSLSGTISLPVGVYEKNEFKLTLDGTVSGPILLLTGTYTEASGTKIPVRFELNQAQIIKLEAARVEITSGNYVAKVTIQLNALVTGLLASDFGQTTRAGTNNSIIVSSTINRALYEKLTARFASALSVSFTKQ